MSADVIQKAELHLVTARRQLLDFAGELGQGKWAGKEGEATIRIVQISEEMDKGIALLFASDGAEGPVPPSLNFQ